MTRLGVRCALVGALVGAIAVAASGVATQAALAQSVMEATTSTGERVRLMPDGRWEYVDQKKAAVQQEARKKEVEARDVELKRERGAQGGGVLGLGRTLYEGDREYNRGSLNPKLK